MGWLYVWGVITLALWAIHLSGSYRLSRGQALTTGQTAGREARQEARTPSPLPSAESTGSPTERPATPIASSPGGPLSTTRSEGRATDHGKGGSLHPPIGFHSAHEAAQAAYWRNAVDELYSVKARPGLRVVE